MVLQADGNKFDGMVQNLGPGVLLFVDFRKVSIVEWRINRTKVQ